MKRTLKVFAWIIVIPLLMLLILGLSLQFPTGQNFWVGKLSQNLSQRWNTEVTVGEVQIKFFKTLEINQLLIKDQQQDTLLAFDQLSSSIGLFSLWTKTLQLDQISIDGLNANLYNHTQDSSFNFQFIIDSFAGNNSEPTVDTTTISSTPWAISLGSTSVKNARFTYRDSIQQFYLHTVLPNLAIDINELDLINQKVSIANFVLDHPLVDVSTLDSEEVDTTNSVLVFPYFAWELDADNLAINQADIRYWVNNQPVQKNVFDAQHLSFRNLDLDAQYLAWDSTLLELQMNQLAFQDQSGFKLINGKADFRLASDEIIIDQLVLNTPSSKIVNNTRLSFASWEVLPDFLNQVTYSSIFENSQLSIADLDFFVPYLPKDYRIKSPIFISGSIKGEKADLQLSNLDLKIGNFFTFQSSGAIANLDDLNKMEINLLLKSLDVNYKKLRTTLPILGLPAVADSLGNIQLSGGFVGGVAEMNLQNIFLQTSTKTFFKASGEVTDLTKVDDLSFKLRIDTLSTQASDLAYFTTSILPVGLYEMKAINYGGLLSGDIHDFKTKGHLTTAIGELETDISLFFSKDYSDARYEGALSLIDFDLGVFMEDTTTFGKISLNAEVQGKGLAAETIEANINSTINSAIFNQYDYKNIEINGNIDRLKYVGAASIKDPNLTFDFEGLVDLNEVKSPVFQFNTLIDTIDFKALGLLSDHVRTSGKIVSDFSGKTIDDFFGNAMISDFYLSNDTLGFYSDTIVLDARNTAKGKKLDLQSDWLKAKLQGDFKLVDLPKLMLNFFNDYFPVDQFVSPIDTPDSLAIEPSQPTQIVDQSFDFNIKLLHPEELSLLFSPVLQRLDSMVVSGRFDSGEKILNLVVDAPYLEVSGWNIDSLNWTLQGDRKTILSQLSVPKIDNGATAFLQNTIDFKIGDNYFDANVLLNNRLKESVLEWGAQLTPVDENYQLQFKDSLLVDQELWMLKKEHKVLFRQGLLQIKDFQLSKNEQSLSIVSYDKPKDEDYTPIEVNFNNFKLAEFSALTKLEGFEYDGLLNGKVRANDLTGNLHYLANMTIDEFIVNDTLIGLFTIRAEQNLEKPVVNVAIGLSGNNNELNAQGTYDIDNNTFDVKADIPQIPLILIDPFTFGAIQKSSGYASGNFTVKGTPEEPIVDGQLKLKDASTRINYLQTRYQIAEHTFFIHRENIEVGNLDLLDAQKNKATLSGNIRHQNFQQYWFNLEFNTDNFRFLNTKRKDNDLFYGLLNLSAQVSIRGTLELPKIIINAKTETGSQLSVNAILEEEIAQQAEYVIFGKPGDTPLDSILLVRSKSYSTIPMELLINLELTPDAELVVIIDPSTGDMLKCKGNANITVEMFPDGEVSILGLYTLVSGSYQFNYQGLVKRSFNLVPGGRLNFIGDPFDTRFDLTANYETKTNLYNLIGNESNLSEPATRAAKERTEVKVLLKINGNLDQPQVNFDLEIPDIDNADLSSLATQKLNRLREDESELNKQVFGLLLLNSFVAEQSATASLSTTGENIALSSVSSLISNQLNRLSENYVKGLGLTFDLDSNKSQFSDGTTTSTTNLNVGLTQSLFNDRLSLKVGGVARIENSADQSASSGLSNIAGDFVLEYQMTKSGNYILRVFQRSDYDAFNESNVNKTGVGINFKKTFGK